VRQNSFVRRVIADDSHNSGAQLVATILGTPELYEQW